MKERSLGKLAQAQHGLITREQLLRTGATRSFIEHCLNTGRWIPIHAGVYRVAGAPESFHQALLAACLATVGPAVASHRSAAVLWGLPGFNPGIPEVTVARPYWLRLRGVRCHTSTRLQKADRTRVQGVPTSTPARTIIDLAGVIPAADLEVALDGALSRGLVSIRGIYSRLEAIGTVGRRGASTLGSLLQARSPTRRSPESPLETKLLQILRTGGLPLPKCQFVVREEERVIARLDFAFPEYLVGLETDGFAFHSGRQAWERDLSRTNALGAQGWCLLRFTSSDLRSDPGRVCRIVEETLRARGWPQAA